MYAAHVGVGSASLEEDPDIKLDILRESLNLLVQSVKQEKIERREKEHAEALVKGKEPATPRKEVSSSPSKLGFSSRKQKEKAEAQRKIDEELARNQA